MKKKNCTLYYITALGKFVGLLPTTLSDGGRGGSLGY